MLNTELNKKYRSRETIAWTPEQVALVIFPSSCTPPIDILGGKGQLTARNNLDQWIACSRAIWF